MEITNEFDANNTVVIEELIDKVTVSENHTSAAISVELQFIQGIPAFID